VMILVGVIAYYSSAPGAGGELARPAVSRLRQELAPLMAPTLTILRAWRSVRRRKHGASQVKVGGLALADTATLCGQAHKPRPCHATGGVDRSDRELR
jgi:hypothetical protein